MRAISLALALLVPAPAFAEVLVGPLGSGAPFTSIQAALDSAPAGERVRVLAGTYEECLTVVKGVDLVGTDTSAVLLRSPAGSSQPLVRVTGVPAGAFARVSGLRLELGAGAAPIAVVDVDACVGAVELHDLRAPELVLGPFASGIEAALLRVRASDPVVVSQCTFQASPLPSLVPAGPVAHGVAGVRVAGSRLFVTHTTVAAGWGSTPISGAGLGGIGGDGIVAHGSILELGAATVVGGESGGTSLALAGLGGAGLRAHDTRVMIAGGTGATLAGAPGVFAEPVGAVLRYASPGVGALLGGSSALEHAIDALPEGGVGMGPFPTPPGIALSGAATVTAFPERLPILGYDAAIAKIAGISRRIYEGEPGSIHWVFASIEGTYPALDFAGIGVLVCWGPPLIQTPPVVLDASGGVTLHLPVPNDPNIAWLHFVVQSVQFTPVTGLRLSPPTLLRVVP